MKIGYIGAGKLGMPVAACVAQKHDVLMHDAEPSVYMRWGRYPFVESVEGTGFATLNELMEAVRPNARFTHDLRDMRDRDIIFVAVQTPHDPQYEGVTPLPETTADFNYRYLIEALGTLAKAVEGSGRQHTVVVISTCLPGTYKREIEPLATGWGNINLVYNPYFIAMGTVIPDFLNPEFVLVGSEDYIPAQLVSFYGSFNLHTRIRAMSITSAEATKVFYNTFISMKLSFANIVAEACEKVGADCDDVMGAIKAANKRLISPAYLTPGMGDGGGCLPAGEIVITEDGPRAIDTIKAGDRVLASNGKLQTVVKVWERPYSGDMMTLRAEGMPSARFTADHTMYAARDGRHICPGGQRDTRLAVAAKLAPLEQIAAGELVEGDFIPVTTPVGDQMAAPEHATPEYCELAGWYLSEGSLDVPRFGSARVAFHLHEKERHIAERLGSIMLKLFPPKVSGRGAGAKAVLSAKQSTKSITMRYGSWELGKLLDRDFGKGAKVKRIPAWAIYGPEYAAKAIIKGMWQGDGHSSQFGMYFATTSQNMAYGAQLILQRFGIPSTLRRIEPRTSAKGQKHDTAYEVRVRNQKHYDALCELTGMKRPPEKDQKLYERFPVRDGETYRKLTSIERQPFSGKVYNLWVDCEEHTFTTNVGYVSNCHPRDNIALSHFAETHAMSFDFFGMLMQQRDMQAAYLAKEMMASASASERGSKSLLGIVGEAFKANTNITTGSHPVLVAVLLRNTPGCRVATFDRFTNGNDPHEPGVYLIGCAHDYIRTLAFPVGSIVIDPWGIVPDQEGVTVRRLGRTRSPGKLEAMENAKWAC